MSNITNDIRYIGVNDHDIDLFEGMYTVPEGMAYNSYVILDDRIAVMDTTDCHFVSEWLANLDTALAGRKPDYLIVHHMEPDHSSGIEAFAKAYPEAKIVATAKAFTMMKNFTGVDYADRAVTVKENDTLDLGSHVGEVVDEVVNFGFEGCVLEHTHALGEGRGHEDVHRRAHARNREVEVAAGQATFASGFDITVCHGDFCAERLEALEVQVHGARAPGASAGERNAATSESGNERAEHIEACAHGLHEFVRCFEMVYTAGVDF